jgi:hypothetical protein
MDEHAKTIVHEPRRIASGGFGLRDHVDELVRRGGAKYGALGLITPPLETFDFAKI